MEGSLPTKPAQLPPQVIHFTDELPWVEDAQKVAPRDARALSRLFFAQLQVLDEGSPEYQYVRNTLIEMNVTLVRFVASRFRGRGGGDLEDIIQVGTIGLIKAIDRFDLSRQVEFTSFAVPSILGEIKRYFRNTSWAVHVPRRLQELRVSLAQAREELAGALERLPTVKELAAQLELSEEEIIEGLTAANGYAAGSLDAPTDNPGARHVSDRSHSYADILGRCDPALSLVEDFLALAPLLAGLHARERRIVQLRFGQEMTQSQIGAELGISQMHVSRLLTRVLTQLRDGMLTDQ
ncbi:SigB/SigF/SigG family RNA polymerase sigma factor [Streptomyces sp. RKAG290]|uniref:SigB/SigF/SigG family RNA polymerase sigma factor n=1 Tax=Streptomyces sp. RKAG290 TaxID=2888348 RepID=UPI0020343FCA|nr:SigB/SigF/SigG family RNA polymerase sigma factor [Streptomyces sp. RKAG290]MCM2416167.1 SigB/SigF/SigG family RNA polymerase sigma factor [Streptomyces sp. RKAG290]